MKILDVPQSGSLAGTTSSHNRFGQYRRSRRSPVQPTDTARRSEVRQNLSAASSGWSTLDQDQREAWITYADAHPVNDALGQSVKLTGHMMYVRINANLLNAGQATAALPPTTDETFVPTDVVLIVKDDGTVTLAFAAVPADRLMLVAASRPQSAGTRFCKSFRQFTVAEAAAEAADISAPFTAAFGAPPLGSNVFFRLTPLNSDGVAGPVLIASKACIAA